MTIATQTATVGYTGNGATTAFAVPFYFATAADLEVYSGGTLRVLNTDYTVTGGPSGSGTVTFGTAPASNVNIRIRRQEPLTQLSDYLSGGTFPAETHEGNLDRLCRQIQQVLAETQRSPKITFDSPSSFYGAALPRPTANGLIGFNATATGFDVFSTNPTAVALAYLDDFSANVAQMQSTVDPGESGTESLATDIYGELQRLRNMLVEHVKEIDPTRLYWYQSPTTAGMTAVNARARGVVGDGSTNITSTLNSLLSSVGSAGGGTVWLPPGTYMINATVSLPSNVCLRGSGKGTTVIKLMAGVAANTQMVTNSDTSGGNTRLSIRDLTLDGNRASNSAISGLSGIRWQNVTWSDVQNVRITGVTLHGVDGSTGNNRNLFHGVDIDDYGTGIFGFGIVVLNNCHYNRIIGCHASNSLNGVGFGIDDRSGGTGPNASNHNVISGCTTEGGDFGIVVQGSSFNTVTGNTIYRPKNYGIQCVSGSDVPGATDALHNAITGNVIEIQTGVNANGIQIAGLYHVVQGNVIRDGQEGILVVDVTEATSDTEGIVIQGNTCVSQSNRGIRIAGGKRITIVGNQVTESGVAGIYVTPDIADSDINAVLIEGNQIVKPGSHGIEVTSTATRAVAHVQIHHNQVFDPSQSSSGSFSGINVNKGAAALNRVSIVGNRVIQSGGIAPKQAVELQNSPTEVDIFDNRNWGFTDNTFIQGVMGYFQGAGGLEFQEMSSGAPSAPAANRAILAAYDNGSGKTVLAVRFGSGASQVIATEP